MKRYMGYWRNGERVIVVIEDGQARDLTARTKLPVTQWKRPMSWGFKGNAVTNAAYSILADCLGDRQAEEQYRRFAADVLERVGQNGFELWESQILEWLEASEAA